MIKRTPIAISAALMLIGCASGPRTGSSAPGFTATTTSGDEVSLATMLGHVTILDFWAVW